jgi:hypothetical protein
MFVPGPAVDWHFWAVSSEPDHGFKTNNGAADLDLDQLLFAEKEHRCTRVQRGGGSSETRLECLTSVGWVRFRFMGELQPSNDSYLMRTGWHSIHRDRRSWRLLLNTDLRRLTELPPQEAQGR